MTYSFTAHYNVAFQPKAHEQLLTFDAGSDEEAERVHESMVALVRAEGVFPPAVVLETRRVS